MTRKFSTQVPLSHQLRTQTQEIDADRITVYLCLSRFTLVPSPEGAFKSGAECGTVPNWFHPYLPPPVNMKPKKQSTHLPADPLIAVEETLERDAVPLVPAVERRSQLPDGTLEHRGHVVAQPVLALEQVLQVGADLVALAVPGLAGGDAAAGLGVAAEGPLGCAAVVVVALVEEALVHAGAVVVVGAGALLHELVVGDLKESNTTG